MNDIRPGANPPGRIFYAFRFRSSPRIDDGSLRLPASRVCEEISMTRCFAPSLLVSFVVASVLSVSAMAQTPSGQPSGQTPAQPPAAQSPATQQKAAAPACTYSSRTYGDGAFLCVEKSLMLNARWTRQRPRGVWWPTRTLATKCPGTGAARDHLSAARALEPPEHRQGNHAAELTAAVLPSEISMAAALGDVTREAIFC